MPHELEIPDDPTFQDRQMRFERIGTCALVLVLVAAALGLFGSGLLNGTRAATADGALSVEYPHFARRLAPLRLRVEVRRVRGSDETGVWIATEYLEHVRFEHVTPEPVRSEAGSSGTTFVFASDARATALVIFLDARALDPGRARGRIGTSAENSVELGHLVYP